MLGGYEKIVILQVGQERYEVIEKGQAAT